jgi:hypothetical protein
MLNGGHMNQQANSTKSSADSDLDHVETVREFALITRGEHPKWEGDRIANSDGFAFRLGREQGEAAYELVRSLGIAETQYSLLTGLPPGSLRRMSAQIKRGIADAKAYPSSSEERSNG